MKLSIITVCFNSEETIEDTIKSVTHQTYHNIEYIIIDGGSTDRTTEIIESYREDICYVISESDEGIWDAMNKGLAASTGEYVGFLNSDDVFASNYTVEEIANNLAKKQVDALFGFVDIVRSDDLSAIVRRYRVQKYTENSLRIGLMPAHPGFFCKKVIFEEFGGFSLDKSLAPDFEMMVRFLVKGKISSCLTPHVLVKMRDGGISNTNMTYILKRFIRQSKSCNVNGLWTHPVIILCKYPYKLLEFFRAK